MCRFFCFFARSVAVPSVVPNSQYQVCIQLNNTNEGCCCRCTCHQLRRLLLLSATMTGPPWLLLLSFIVNRLLIIVYHAVLLLCQSYHPAHAFVWIDEHNIQYSTWSFPDTLVKTSSIFILRFVFFISSDLAHRAPITNSVAVRLFAPDRDSCVLASCGLPLVLLQWSISQFSLRIRTSIVAAYFFIY